MKYRVICSSTKESFTDIGEAVDFAEDLVIRMNRGALLYQLMPEYGEEILRAIAMYDIRYGWRGAIGTPAPKKVKVEPSPPKIPFIDQRRATIDEF